MSSQNVVIIPVFDSKAVVICPKCHKNKRICGVRVKKARAKCCRCDTTFSVVFHNRERKFFRKEVYIEGFCSMRRNYKKHDIVIQDLSCQGMKFCLKYAQINLFVGMTLNIEFNLPDKRNTKICVKVELCRINFDDSISVEFVGVDEYSSAMKAIGFYVRE